MDKKYTKKQIIEAISYWTKQLNVLDEAKNALVASLEKEFGHAIVFSWALDYQLSQEDCEKIFKILNLHLFNNALKPIDIFWWPESKIVERLNQNSIESDESRPLRNAAECYGVFSAVCKDVKDKDGNIIDVKMSKKAILMNSSRLTVCSFIFAVACICHEIIHYYDSFTEEHHRKQLEASINNEGFDSHEDRAFQDKMHEANLLGVNVVEDFGSTNTYINSNAKARYELYAVVGETDRSHIHRFGSGQNLFIKNDKTGTMFYAHFD